MNDEPKTKSENEPEEKLIIQLDFFLQACGVPTGGQAKRLIQGGQILLNGEVETRRRKKLCEGDEVTFDGEVFVVTLVDEEDVPD